MNREDLTPAQLIAQSYDMPISPSVVADIRKASNAGSSPEQLLSIVLNEPTLILRILQFANGPKVKKNAPVLSIKEALRLIGGRTLAELSASFVLMKHASNRDSWYYKVFEKILLTANISSAIHDKINTTKEDKSASINLDYAGYITGILGEFPLLILSYHYPKIIAAAWERAETKSISMARSIQEVSGLSLSSISISLAKEYNIIGPVQESLREGTTTSGHISNPQSKVLWASRISSESLSDAKLVSKSDAYLNISIRDVALLVGLSEDVIHNIVLTSSCNPYLPPPNNQIHCFRSVHELENAATNGEPTSTIVTKVLEILHFELGFDRTLLMLLKSEKRLLCGHMYLGSGVFDPRSIRRSLFGASNSAPDIMALLHSKPVVFGTPVLNGGSPFVAIPIGYRDNAIGVIYADKIADNKHTVLTEDVKSTVAQLSHLMDQAIAQGR